jgi:Na+-transporting NADH:ubiquinone oxidoreductase subunit B
VSAAPAREAAVAVRLTPARLAQTAPHLRNALDVPRAMRCVLVAALPLVATSLHAAGARVASEQDPAQLLLAGARLFLPLLLAALAAGALVERLFARLRGRPADHSALPVIALLFALGLPPTLPVWQAALGCALGILIGKEIFGGFGTNFVNPALAGLALLHYAYPASFGAPSLWTLPAGLAAERASAACLIGAGLLLYAGVASWRVPAGGVLGLLAALLAASLAGIAPPLAEVSWRAHLVSGGFAFGLVFLATDPVTSAVTNPGRWLCGGLIGALVVTIRLGAPDPRAAVMLAILFANVAAPLLDQIVGRVQMHGLRRRAARAASA